MIFLKLPKICSVVPEHIFRKLFLTIKWSSFLELKEFETGLTHARHFSPTQTNWRGQTKLLQSIFSLAECS